MTTIAIKIDAHGADCSDCDFLYWSSGDSPSGRCEIFKDYPRMVRGEAVRLPCCREAEIKEGGK
jgi:hypothetical protein